MGGTEFRRPSTHIKKAEHGCVFLKCSPGKAKTFMYARQISRAHWPASLINQCALSSVTVHISKSKLEK